MNFLTKINEDQYEDNKKALQTQRDEGPFKREFLLYLKR
jgi:hypothetical protein